MINLKETKTALHLYNSFSQQLEAAGWYRDKCRVTMDNFDYWRHPTQPNASYPLQMAICKMIQDAPRTFHPLIDENYGDFGELA